MSLLHRQIAERARLNPHRGGMPLEMVTHPLTLLVSAVAGEMGSKPLRASVGAIIYVTREEMIARGRPVDEGLKDLNTDVRGQFVYADPILARETATEARKEADSEWAKLTGNVALLKAIADRMDAEAKINEERAKGKPEGQVKKEIAFSKGFLKLKNEWDDFYHNVQFKPEGAFDATYLGNELPNKIDNFRARYISQYEAFQGLGGSPSKPPPAASTVGDVHLPDVIKPVADAASSIVKPILYGGLVLGGVLLFTSVYRPGSSTQPVR